MLNTGSQVNLHSKSLADKLGLKQEESTEILSCATGIENKIKVFKVNIEINSRILKLKQKL